MAGPVDVDAVTVRIGRRSLVAEIEITDGDEVRVVDVDGLELGPLTGQASQRYITAGPGSAALATEGAVLGVGAGAYMNDRARSGDANGVVDGQKGAGDSPCVSVAAGSGDVGVGRSAAECLRRQERQEKHYERESLHLITHHRAEAGLRSTHAGGQGQGSQGACNARTGATVGHDVCGSGEGRRISEGLRNASGILVGDEVSNHSFDAGAYAGHGPDYAASSGARESRLRSRIINTLELRRCLAVPCGRVARVQGHQRCLRGVRQKLHLQSCPLNGRRGCKYDSRLSRSAWQVEERAHISASAIRGEEELQRTSRCRSGYVLSWLRTNYIHDGAVLVGVSATG